ncbi:sterol desaturase family protein [Sphingosinicellaceae bacterium]|nr:sterol desaturase family protein [Sphingosinicellaceae bacterium]
MSDNLSHFAFEVFRLAVWLALLVAVFVPLERLFALRTGKAWRPGVLTDLGYYFLSSLVPAVLLGLPMALVATAVHTVVPASYYAAVAALPAWSKIALAFLVGETGFYWGHRLSHHVPLLWRFHAVHHSPAHLDFLINTRAHPVDMLFTRLCGLVPLYALGLAGTGAGGASLPALVIVVGSFWGFFIHANLRWRLGPLEWLVATPAFHHWHHTRREHIDRNFASMLPALDRLFGTHHLPREWPAEYGTDTVMAPTLAGQMVQPFQRPASRAVVSPCTTPGKAASAP